MNAVADVIGETQKGGSVAAPGLKLQSSLPKVGSFVGVVDIVGSGGAVGSSVEKSSVGDSSMIVCSVGETGALVHPTKNAIRISVKLIRDKVASLSFIRSSLPRTMPDPWL